MARTVQDVLDRVQVLLSDAIGERYTVPQLLGTLNDAVLEARSIRPDLFVARYAEALPQVAGPADPFPLPDQFFPAVCFYVAGVAELRDDEFAVDGRAATLLSTFGKKLTVGA